MVLFELILFSDVLVELIKTTFTLYLKAGHICDNYELKRLDFKQWASELFLTFKLEHQTTL